MRRRVLLRPEAQAEAREARSWYRNISPTLAARFRSSVAELIFHVRERPEMFPLIHADVRRALTQGFPYALFYVIRDSDVVVLAIRHQMQDHAPRVAAAGEPRNVSP